MMKLRFAVFFHFFICLCYTNTQGQGDCVTSGGALYGSPTSSERGKSIAATPGNDGIYVAGSKDDSTLILRVNLEGVVVWSRTMDIVPNDEEHISALIVDSEGMLGLSGIGGDLGTGGSVFAFRYNPTSHQILWLYEYLTFIRNYNSTLIEKGNGGNYLMSNNPHDSNN